MGWDAVSRRRVPRRFLAARRTGGYPRRVILPPPLRRGDPVRVVAPSSPFDPAALAKGLEVLSGRLGLLPRMRTDLTARRAYLAGDDARRAEEWREAVADPEARAIFCARGGRAPGTCPSPAPDSSPPAPSGRAAPRARSSAAR